MRVCVRTCVRACVCACIQYKCPHHAHMQWISKCVECNAMDSASNKLAMAFLSKQQLHLHVWGIVRKLTNMSINKIYEYGCHRDVCH